MDNSRKRIGLRRLVIRNYKSVSFCEVELSPFVLFVGRNGSGKSNVLDALRFVVDSLTHSLDHAIRIRGGIDDVRRRSTGHPRNFSIGLDLLLDSGQTALFEFEIAARPNGGFAVKHERARISSAQGEPLASYTRVEESVSGSEPNLPPVGRDRLYLLNAAGLPQFRALYDSITSMGFYSLNPEVMKEVHSPDAGELLQRDGANIASAIARLKHSQPDAVSRIQLYLSTIVPGIESVERISLGPKETLLFRQQVRGSEYPWKFYASSMSDGTLRALGALVAVMQTRAPQSPVKLVGIEEPETALHPAAAGALIDALREATTHTQVMITTHSPDLLDEINLETDTLLVVFSEENETRVARPDQASLKAIRDHLYTPGDLLRMDQLQPDPQHIEDQLQANLFGDPVASS